MFSHITSCAFTNRFGTVYHPRQWTHPPIDSWEAEQASEKRFNKALNEYLFHINATALAFRVKPAALGQYQLKLDACYCEFLDALEDLPESLWAAFPKKGYYLESPSEEWIELLQDYRKGQFYAGVVEYEQRAQDLLETGSKRITGNILESWRSLNLLYDQLEMEASKYPQLELSLPPDHCPQKLRMEATAEAVERATFCKT